MVAHIKSQHEGRKFACDVYLKTFTLRFKLTQHTKNVHRDFVIRYASPIIVGQPQAFALTSPAIAPVAVAGLWDDTVADNEFLEILADFEDQGPSTFHKRPNPNSRTARNLKIIRLNIVNILGFVKIGSAHSHKIVWYYARNINNLNSYPSFFDTIKSSVIEILSDRVQNQPIKFNLKLELTFNRPTVDDSSD